MILELLTNKNVNLNQENTGWEFGGQWDEFCSLFPLNKPKERFAGSHSLTPWSFVYVQFSKARIFHLNKIFLSLHTIWLFNLLKAGSINSFPFWKFCPLNLPVFSKNLINNTKFTDISNRQDTYLFLTIMKVIFPFKLGKITFFSYKPRKYPSDNNNLLTEDFS